MSGFALEWDVYQQACPSRMMIDRIADKWVLLILGIVEHGPVRFNQLRRQVEGISQKSLTETLRGLERDGLVRREVIASSPVAVEYSITPLGQTLAQAAETVRLWAQAHMDEVIAAQRRFDSTRP
jgi:DNA-binding HxlR family transcriptional regulator